MNYHLLALSVPPAESSDRLVTLLNDPMSWMALLVFVFLIVTFVVINRALNNIKIAALKAQGKWTEKDEEEAHESSILKALTAAVPVERESEVMTDHEYDGIRELDNRLPPWWLYGFYISIIFAVVYMVRFHITGQGKLSHEEYVEQMAEAEAATTAYLEKMGNQVDETNVTMLDDASSLESGAATFATYCASCHAQDGGGIAGPNLTDEYWVNGGGIVNVFSTIKNGGRQGTAMIPWKDQLGPRKIQEVASYVLSLQGTTPAQPKEAEGEIWVEEAAAPDAAEVQDSTVTEETETVEE